MKPKDVDEYIQAAPESMQPGLREVRRIVFAAAPGVTEKISYGMPTYDVAGRRLLHFAAAKHHIAVYALVHVDGAIPKELADYVDHRSTLHFRPDQPLPAEALSAAIKRKLGSL